ncbi:ubiquitin conjugating enzyme 1, partial [Xylogone sp. PMI_703]
MADISLRKRRIRSELKFVHSDPESGVKVWLVDDSDLNYFQGSFVAPPGTPYAGGTYHVDITLPDRYPFVAPTIRFTTKIWHPNISSQTGACCVLESGWTPTFSIIKVLLALLLLLESPNPNDPLDTEAARMMIDDRPQFELKAREYALRYAGA